MDKGDLSERDNPKSLLLPGAFPLPVHTLIQRGEDSDSDHNLPSTIDLDAIKGAGLSDTPFQNVMDMGWRSSPRIKVKQPHSETPRKDQYVANALAESQSKSESRNSEVSSSETEDSESESDSSGENASSVDSSASSDTSDSDTDSNKSSVKSERPGGKLTNFYGGVLTEGASQGSRPLKSNDTQSRSNSSTSSRSRKLRKKSFSINQSNYEPGSLKLRIAAFDIPSRPNQPQTHGAKSPVSSNSNKVVDQSPRSKWKAANGDGSNSALVAAPVTVNGGSTDMRSTINYQNKTVTPVPVPCSNDNRRITRQSLSHKDEDTLTVTHTQSNSPKIQSNGFTSDLETPSSLGATKSNREACPETIQQQFSFSNTKNKFVPVGVSSQLTDSVTMTRLIVAPTSRETPEVSSVSITTTPTLHTISRSRNEQHLSDPVLYLATNSDLSIFPINPSESRVPSWSPCPNIPKVRLTPTVDTATAHVPSRVKVSRRLSVHRRSIEKSDVESWDGTDQDISAAIKTVDSVVDSEKPRNSISKNITGPTRVSNSKTKCHSSNSSSSSGYNSSLLETVSKVKSPVLPNVRLSLSPKLNLSIKPIHPLSSEKVKSKDSETPSHSPKIQSLKNRRPHSKRSTDSELKVAVSKGYVEVKTEKTTTECLKKIYNESGEGKMEQKSPRKSSGSSSVSTASSSCSSSKGTGRGENRQAKNKLSIFVASSIKSGSEEVSKKTSKKGTKGRRSRSVRSTVVGAYTNTTKMPSVELKSMAPPDSWIEEEKKTKNKRSNKGKKGFRQHMSSNGAKGPKNGRTIHKVIIGDSLGFVTEKQPEFPSTGQGARSLEGTRIISQGQQSSSSVSPTTPAVRTKAAKKYIPEPEENATKKQFSKDKLVSVDKKWKKAKERKNINNNIILSRLSSSGGGGNSSNLQKSKRSKPILSEQELTALCESLQLHCRIFDPAPAPITRSLRNRKEKRSHNSEPSPPRSEEGNRKLERFTFEIMVFTNFLTPFTIPAPSFSSPAWRPNTQFPPVFDAHSFQYQGDGTIASPVQTPTPIAKSTNSVTTASASNRRKRGMVPTKTQITSSVNAVEYNITENSAELQRLPLKKRHGHTSHNYKETKCEYRKPNLGVLPHSFGFIGINPVKELRAGERTSAFFEKIAIEQTDFPSFHNFKKSNSGDRSSKKKPRMESPDKTSVAEIIVISVSVDSDLEIISPPAITPTGTKKRRKVNRTGFPSVKKKKKIGSLDSSPVTEDGPPRLTSTASTEKLTLRKEEPLSPSLYAGINSETPVASLQRKKRGRKPGKATKAVVDHLEVKPEHGPSSSTLIISEKSEGFTPSLTERVKIRKRSSVDGITPLDQAKIMSGEIVIPGVVPSLLNIPDPPIIMPVKTNYLVAGLLAPYYKKMVPPPVLRGEALAEAVAKRKASKESFLPSPADLGLGSNWLDTVQDFQLPYDIWCFGVIRTREKYEEWVVEEEDRRAREREQKKVENRRKSDSVAIIKPKKVRMPSVTPDSWNFKRLRSNAYFGFSKPPVTSETEVDQLCECKETDFKCGGEDCLNRVIYAECPPACGDNCMNRRIQKHDWAPHIRRFLTEDKGYGVKTLKTIKRAEFILEYVGEVVNDATFKERMNTTYKNDTHHYCLQLDSGRVIDGHRSGGEGRFVNHSCEPNCEMQKWSVNGLSRMALFALRDINDGEELSYDYNFSLYNPSEGQPCHCKSVNCRGVIGGKTKNNTSSNKSKRKSGNSKGAHGIADSVSGAHADPAVLEKMKVLSRKERNFITKGRCFLVRNYEKARRMRGEVEDKVGDKLAKLMSSWVLRYKVGSTKHKPLFLGEQDPKLTRLARIAQIFYELYASVVSTKDSAGKLLCEPFMDLPPRRKYPIFHSALEQQKLQGFRSIERNILHGDYAVIQAFEADLGLLLTSFSVAFEAERPEVKDLMTLIKNVYKGAKQRAIQALDPFIVSRGSRHDSVGQTRSSTSNALPAFQKFGDFECEDVIRCICGTFSEEGLMVQCEKCMVWQHGDCMRLPPDKTTETSKNKPKAGRRRKVWSPKKVNSKSALARIPSPKRTISTDSDEKEKVEFGEGEVISVKEALPLLEAKDDEVEHFSGTNALVSQMETQKIEPEIPEFSDPFTQESRKSENPYYCEMCDPRAVDPEIPMGGNNDTPEKTHYLTLQREDGVILRKNDTVYVLREWPEDQRLNPDGSPKQRKTYQNAGPLVPSECDIFRIDSLWRDDKGNRLVMGYNYLRPHETHHEPSRKFYPNEILRAPIHEMIGIELIHGRCWVVDTPTYCKGRPKGYIEDHLYICDLRVDRTARSFDKVGKRSQMICTKPFAFDHFVTKLKIQRNVHPHGPPSPDFKAKASTSQASGGERGRPRKTEEKAKTKNVPSAAELAQASKERSMKCKRLMCVLDEMHLKVEGFLTDKIDTPQLLLKDEKRSEKTRKSLIKHSVLRAGSKV